MEIQDIISNVNIYDLEESIVASGYAMRTEKIPLKMAENDLKRAEKLIRATKTDNPAHGQFMTGIRVNFDLTFSNKAWVEAERYRFLEFVTSQSTMHRITRFDLDKQYMEYVDPRIIDIMKEKVKEYQELFEKFTDTSLSFSETDKIKEKMEKKYLEILYSNPSGFRITARMATNYRCLRNIYQQRKDHRLPEWRIFCQWIATLPYAEKLLIN